MQERHARMLRAAVVSVVVLALSAGAHQAGGGMLPHPAVLVGFATLTMLASIVVAKRTLGLPALLAVLGGGQFALHQAFEFLSTTTTMVCASASTHLDHSAALTCTVGSAESHQHAVQGGGGVTMFAAHVIATLATAILITRGEEALHAVARWMRPLFTVLRTSPVRPPAWIIPVVQAHRLPAVPFLVSPPLRGPPAFR
ncbi:hypothetical protein ACFY5D_02090 [Paeniglutamicibacter sp. NPDC012692]|uniref:hypothetical protein n=1 Tax=Paeniglutamicibacter sp. NPDC012692 TaxID=3364388 RepID=UPI0036B4DB85